jgi:prepilin peptidase CpaA
MVISVSLLLTSLLGRAALTDFFYRRIPNDVVIGVSLLWLTQPLLIGMEAAAVAVAVASVVLVGGITAWRAGWLGAGDVKLLSALALWAGSDRVLLFIVVTALCGGALAFSFLFAKRTGLLPLLWFDCTNIGPAPLGHDSTASPCRPLPYGLAIVAGGLWLIYSSAA